jgi:meiotic recombination protein SPO11
MAYNASARFYALVDADPHGLDILSVYTNGSQATKFSYDHADLALGDRLEWMGVKASEWALSVLSHPATLLGEDADHAD